MIYLYHGTDVPFDAPNPKRGRKGTDFGQGFYLTPDFEAASRMAKRVARRKNSNTSVVMCFALDEKELAAADLKVRALNYIDSTWLGFVVANRYFQQESNDHNLDQRWDIVHGMVADDKVVMLLNALVKGESSEELVLAKLKSAPFKTVQYSFHTERAVSLLRLVEVKNV